MLLSNFLIQWFWNILLKNNISMMLNKCLISWFWADVTKKPLSLFNEIWFFNFFTFLHPFLFLRWNFLSKNYFEEQIYNPHENLNEAHYTHSNKQTQCSTYKIQISHKKIQTSYNFRKFSLTNWNLKCEGWLEIFNFFEYFKFSSRSDFFIFWKNTQFFCDFWKKNYMF